MRGWRWKDRRVQGTVRRGERSYEGAWDMGWALAQLLCDHQWLLFTSHAMNLHEQSMAVGLIEVNTGLELEEQVQSRTKILETYQPEWPEEWRPSSRSTTEHGAPQLAALWCVAAQNQEADEDGGNSGVVAMAISTHESFSYTRQCDNHFQLSNLTDSQLGPLDPAQWPALRSSKIY